MDKYLSVSSGSRAIMVGFVTPSGEVASADANFVEVSSFEVSIREQVLVIWFWGCARVIAMRGERG